MGRRVKPQRYAKDIPVWEQQPDESAKAYAPFAIYRDMGTMRSIKAVADAMKIPKPNLSQWSVRHAWVYRADQYDQNQEIELHSWMIEAKKAAIQDEIRVSRDLRSRCEAEFATRDFSEISMSELIRLLEVAVKIERDVLQLTRDTNITINARELEQTIQVLSPETLEIRLKELTEEATRRVEIGKSELESSPIFEGDWVEEG